MTGERGNGRFGVFVWLLVMAAGLFVAFKAIPVRVAVLELHDYADKQLQFAATSGHGVDQKKLVVDILKKAKELEIALEPEDIALTISTGEVEMTMKHQVAVDLAVYTWVWDFDQRYKHMRM